MSRYGYLGYRVDPDQYMSYGEYAGHLAIVFLVVFLVFYVFTLVLLLLDKDHRSSPLHLLTASAIFGHLLASLVLTPGSIRVRLLNLPVTEAYCWLWHHGLLAYMFFVPYALLVYCIERLIYMVNPTVHKERLNKYAIAAMVSAPWIAGVLFCVAMVNGYSNTEVMTTWNRTRESNQNMTHHVCWLINTGHPHDRDSFVGIVIAVVILALLILATTSLIIWCCYKENLMLGTNFMMMGEHIHTHVRDSVIGLSLLSYIGVVPFFVTLIWMTSLPLDTILLSVFGVLEGLVWIGTIQPARDRLIRLCTTWCGLRNTGPEGAVHFNRNIEDAEDVAFHE